MMTPIIQDISPEGKGNRRKNHLLDIASLAFRVGCHKMKIQQKTTSFFPLREEEKARWKRDGPCSQGGAGHGTDAVRLPE
jgi:hypothetical protein